MLTLEDLKRELKPIKSDIKTMKEDISKIREDQNTIIAFFDSHYLDLRKRVERIEEVLNLPQS